MNLINPQERSAEEPIAAGQTRYFALSVGANEAISGRFLTIRFGGLRITGGPIETTPEVEPAFTFEGAGDAPLQCRVDFGGYAGSWVSCASPARVGPPATGPHAFFVRRAPSEADPDPSPVARSFTVVPLHDAALVTVPPFVENLGFGPFAPADGSPPDLAGAVDAADAELFAD